jgi:hypothetical protein
VKKFFAYASWSVDSQLKEYETKFILSTKEKLRVAVATNYMNVDMRIQQTYFPLHFAR